MKNYFITRPILSIVLSTVIVILGLTCLNLLPVQQYPNLSPPVVSISAQYPGASAETIAEAIATPFETAILEAENMIYMSSTSQSPGSMNLTAYFRTGTDPNVALLDVQNRINSILSTIPPDVTKLGVSISLSSPNLLLFAVIQDQLDIYDKMFLANYVTVHIVPELQRIPGIGEVLVSNGSDYSMRIWLKPDQMAQFKLTAADVKNAVLEQNALHSLGEIGQEPTPSTTKLTIPVTTSGQLSEVSEFENIILRADPDGATVLLKDISRVELGSQSYTSYATLNGKSGAFIAVHLASGANALEVSEHIKKKLQQLSPFFPTGIDFSIPYDTSLFIKTSIKEVVKTLFEAALLVSLVICFFLHSFRAALIPILAMIVSIVGTLLGLYLLGYSINLLTLFGMILAIGIVVDDAIVVVENVELNMRTLKISSKEAVAKTMKDVSAPIVAIVFALFSIFIPIAFIGGLTGQLYKQFAVTIVISVVISGFVALTLSPVLSEFFLKNIHKSTRFGIKFNQIFTKITDFYIRGVDWLIQRKTVGICSWLIFLGGLGIVFHFAPVGFVPIEDQGFILIEATLPDGASLTRTKAVSSQIENIVKETPGIKDIIEISGDSGTNHGTYYISLKEWSQRKAPDLQASSILKSLNKKLKQIPEAKIIAHNPAPIPGIGSSSFYDFWVVNQGVGSLQELYKVVNQMVEKGKTRPEISYINSTMAIDSLSLNLAVEKIKAKALGIKLDDLFYTLQMLLGSIYINDFSKYGKLYKVIAQSEPSFRDSIDDIGNIYIPSSSNQMIPLKSVVIPKFSRGPTQVTHFNGSEAAQISVGLGAPSDQVISVMEEMAKETLLPGMFYSWSGAAYEAKASTNSVIFTLLGGVLMLFLALAALYERWILPLIVLLVLPLGVLGALLAIWTRGLEMDLYFQIGLIASIGISAKNAILIVEFARNKRREGMGIVEAAIAAARLRFRAILMTSLTLIFAIFPLAISTGASAASKHSVGTGVLGGIFLATLLGIFFVPFFFRLMERKEKSD